MENGAAHDDQDEGEEEPADEDMGQEDGEAPIVVEGDEEPEEEEYAPEAADGQEDDNDVPEQQVDEEEGDFQQIPEEEVDEAENDEAEARAALEQDDGAEDKQGDELAEQAPPADAGHEMNGGLY